MRIVSILRRIPDLAIKMEKQNDQFANPSY